MITFSKQLSVGQRATSRRMLRTVLPPHFIQQAACEAPSLGRDGARYNVVESPGDRISQQEAQCQFEREKNGARLPVSARHSLFLSSIASVKGARSIVNSSIKIDSAPTKPCVGRDRGQSCSTNTSDHFADLLRTEMVQHVLPLVQFNFDIMRLQGLMGKVWPLSWYWQLRTGVFSPRLTSSMINGSFASTNKGCIIGDKMGTGRPFFLNAKLQLCGQRPAVPGADRKLF